MSRKFEDEFIEAYLVAALWTTAHDCPKDSDTNGYLEDDYMPYDINSESLERVTSECNDFLANTDSRIFELDAAQCGHDFWLTRNGHGVGFWDRGLGELGDKLTADSERYGEANVMADGETFDHF